MNKLTKTDLWSALSLCLAAFCAYFFTGNLDAEPPDSFPYLLSAEGRPVDASTFINLTYAHLFWPKAVFLLTRLSSMLRLPLDTYHAVILGAAMLGALGVAAFYSLLLALGRDRLSALLLTGCLLFSQTYWLKATSVKLYIAAFLFLVLTFLFQRFKGIPAVLASGFSYALALSFHLSCTSFLPGLLLLFLLDGRVAFPRRVIQGALFLAAASGGFLGAVFLTVPGSLGQGSRDVPIYLTILYNFFSSTKPFTSSYTWPAWSYKIMRDGLPAAHRIYENLRPPSGPLLIGGFVILLGAGLAAGFKNLRKSPDLSLSFLVCGLAVALGWKFIEPSNPNLFILSLPALALLHLALSGTKFLRLLPAFFLLPLIILNFQAFSAVRPNEWTLDRPIFSLMKPQDLVLATGFYAEPIRYFSKSEVLNLRVLQDDGGTPDQTLRHLRERVLAALASGKRVLLFTGLMDVHEEFGAAGGVQITVPIIGWRQYRDFLERSFQVVKISEVPPICELLEVRRK